MARAGMINIGQLARERWPRDTGLVGFAGYQGSVIAGTEWGAEMQRMPVPPARAGSWEHLLHEAVGRDSLLFTDMLTGYDAAEAPRGHRAIGVVYHPERERWGNYVPTILPSRYDALLYFEQTHALAPLHMPPHETGEPGETYPSGM
jgi:erythromycin esterase-like protein